MTLKGGFPETVNETSARLVAAGVVGIGVGFLVFRQGWLLVPLTYGFVARVIAGPRFSPLGRLVTDIFTPRLLRALPHAVRLVSGRPKRFAQGVGVIFTVTASIAWLLGAASVAVAAIAVLVVCAALESFAGLCVGCVAYRQLIRVGWLPADACVDCADITGRLQAATSDRR